MNGRTMLRLARVAAAAAGLSSAPRELAAQEHRVIVARLTAIDGTQLSVAASTDSAVHVAGVHLGMATDGTFYPECARAFARDIDSIASVPVSSSSNDQYNFPRVFISGNVAYQRRVDGASPYQHWLYFSSDGLPGSSGLAVSTIQLRAFTRGLRVAADKTDSISRRDRLQVCGSVAGDRPHLPEATSSGVVGSRARNDVYFEFQVEKQAAPDPRNAPVRYPDMLRSAKVEGEVLAQFVVDTMGRADTSTFKALKSTHDLFTNAVKDALSSMAFTPAQIGGKRVKQLVQMPFRFSLGSPPASEPERAVSRWRVWPE